MIPLSAPPLGKRERVRSTRKQLLMPLQDVGRSCPHLIVRIDAGECLKSPHSAISRPGFGDRLGAKTEAADFRNELLLSAASGRSDGPMLAINSTR